MKLWLDDVRTPPDETWEWKRTYDEALEVISKNLVKEISFDHDLGDNFTGYTLAKAIEQYAYYGLISRIKWNIHSANPVGRRNIEMAMKNADKYWGKIDS